MPTGQNRPGEMAQCSWMQHRATRRHMTGVRDLVPGRDVTVGGVEGQPVMPDSR